jgi:hypothetical protein
MKLQVRRECITKTWQSKSNLNRYILRTSYNNVTHTLTSFKWNYKYDNENLVGRGTRKRSIKSTATKITLETVII